MSVSVCVCVCVCVCVWLLPNQTWVHSPVAQQSQSTDTRLWGKKVQHLLQGQARRMGSLCSKDLNSMAFRKGFLKATFGMRIAAYGPYSDWLMVR